MSTAKIYYGLYDITAKQDSTFTCNQKADFIDLNNLKLDSVQPPKVATDEHNYWKLDGTFSPFPNNPQEIVWGLWSNTKTGSDGNFTTPVTLTISMSGLHSSLGISFEFNPYDNNYCTKLDITWYHGTTQLSSKTYYPNNWRYFCENNITNYDKLVIVFYGTNRPDRYLKVQNILHGAIQEFGSDTLVSANLLQEVDLTGSELSINTVDFTLYSETDDFNIFNPKGMYKLLQKKQQVTVEGEIDGFTTLFGNFYIDSWKQASNNMMELSANDAIGIMDKTYFLGGIYTNKKVTELIAEIMNDAGFGYYIDGKFTDYVVSGWIPYSTHREALQQVVFAIGAFVDTSGGGTVKVRSQPVVSDSGKDKIGIDRKWLGTSVELKEYITEIKVTAHNYSLSTTSEEIYSETLATGTYLLTFDNAYSGYSITNGTITESGANYCKITVSGTKEVKITAKKYNDSTSVTSVKLPEIEAGEAESVYSVTDATLVSSDNVLRVANQLLNYYQKRISQNVTFVLKNENTGDIIDVETSKNILREGIIEKLDIDLIGGFSTKAVITGE